MLLLACTVSLLFSYIAVKMKQQYFKEMQEYEKKWRDEWYHPRTEEKDENHEFIVGE